MKKILIACFFVVILLLLPISGVTQTAYIPKIRNISKLDEEIPKIYITEMQRIQLVNFIEGTFEEEEKFQAYNILNNVINDDLEVDFVNLSNNLTLYIYTPIPEDDLNNVTNETELNDLLNTYWGINEEGFIENLFGTLLIKIIEFIKDRLGWFYDLFDKGISLFYGGITLFVDVIKPASLVIAILFVAVINKILTAPKVFSEAIKELFQLEFENFTKTSTDFIDQFGVDIIDLIDAVNDFIENPEIEAYFTEIQSFIVWLDEKHWEDKILVIGSVATIFDIPWTDVTVTCRGQSTVTDSNGMFNFMVDPNPDEDSFPKNQYFGIHNCQISISKDGEVLKQTLKILSYSFSGGKINESFVIIKGKTKERDFRSIRIEKINNILVSIFMFFNKILGNIEIVKSRILLNQ
jgi:hypothetical protein